jgi:hypothetical protein
MAEAVRGESLADEALKDVGDNDEQVGREGVPLTLPVFAADPRTGNSI